jgi:hypothetical protein
MERKKIEGLNIWIAEKVGDKLKGLIKKIDNDAQFGIQDTIKMENGKEILTPSHKWLQNCLRQLKVGDLVEIEYEGEEPPKVKGQSPTKKYTVYLLE